MIYSSLKSWCLWLWPCLETVSCRNNQIKTRSCRIRVRPKSIRTDVLIKRDIFEDIEDTEGCRPCSEGGDWSNAATRQGIPSVAGHHRRLGGGREWVFHGAFRGRTALLSPWFWTYGFQTCETISFSCLWTFSLWLFVATLGNRVPRLKNESCAYMLSLPPLALLNASNLLFEKWE